MLCRPLNWCSPQITRHFSLAAFKMFSVWGFQKFNYGVCQHGFLWVPPVGGGRSRSFWNLQVYVFCEAGEFWSHYLFKPREATFEHILQLRSSALEWASGVQEPLRLHKMPLMSIFLRRMSTPFTRFSNHATALINFIKELACGLIVLFLVSLVKTNKNWSVSFLLPQLLNSCVPRFPQALWKVGWLRWIFWVPNACQTNFVLIFPLVSEKEESYKIKTLFSSWEVQSN